MSIRTTDLCDAHEAGLHVLDPLLLRSYGGRTAFSGPIHTLKVYEDNSLVRAALETAGDGRVLVVDGGGSTRCALVGDVLAQLALNNNWGGIIVNGCIRDSGVIDTLDVGVRALGTNPRRSVKRGIGDSGIPVTFGGVTFAPGHWLYADDDGIIVSESNLTQ